MLAELGKYGEKDQAFLLMTALHAPKGGKDLLAALSPNRAQALRGALEELLQDSSGGGADEILRALLRLQGKGKDSLLYHADPGWFLEAFRDESPRVLTILLEKISKIHLGRILQDLPKETRKEMKKIDASRVPTAIRRWVQERAESRFPRIRMASLKEDEVLDQLQSVKLDTFQKMLGELGLSEMAMAFSNISRSATRAILNRLPVSEAKELRKRIQNKISVSLKEQREAQLHILSLDFEKIPPEEIILEIGFGVFSRAFGKADGEASTYFIYKLPPARGYLLKRYIEKNAASHTPETVQKTRERILDALTKSQ